MHSDSVNPDIVTRAGALALTALFDPGVRRDRAVLATIFEAAREVDSKLFDNLKLYLDDPIGVRNWPMSGPAFFGNAPPPVASPVAIARIREARVAAAYGLRLSAIESLSMTLHIPPARMQQITSALEVYERGVLATIAAQRQAEEISERASEEAPEGLAATPTDEEPANAPERAAGPAKEPSKATSEVPSDEPALALAEPDPEPVEKPKASKRAKGPAKSPAKGPAKSPAKGLVKAKKKN